MKNSLQSKKRVRSALIAASLGMTVVLSACGSSKTITLYGTDEEYGTVTLGNYKGLSAEKKVYAISDEMVASEMEYMLYDYTDYKSVDRAAKDDDYLSLNIKATADGATVLDSSEEEGGVYETQLGYETYGDEFDEKLIGAKKGDHLTFSVTYDSDFDFEDLAGKKVDFDVTVADISEEVTPELTPEFIKESLGFDSEDALKQSIRDNLNEQYSENSKYALYYELLGQVVEQSTIEKYSDDLYNACYSSVEQNYMSYMDMLGCETLDEVFAAFGITTADLEQEALDQVNQQVVVNAIAKAENMELKKADYDQKIETLAKEYEYESAKEFLADYEESDIKYMVMETMVFELLAENANLTEVTVDPESEENEYGDEDIDADDDEVDFEDVLLEDADELDELSGEDADELDDEDADEDDADSEEDDDDEEDDEIDDADEDDEDLDEIGPEDTVKDEDEVEDDAPVEDDEPAEEPPAEANSPGETELNLN